MNDGYGENTCPALENQKPRFRDRLRRFVRCPGWLPLQWWTRFTGPYERVLNPNWYKTTWWNVCTGKHRKQALRLSRP